MVDNVTYILSLTKTHLSHYPFRETGIGQWMIKYSPPRHSYIFTHSIEIKIGVYTYKSPPPLPSNIILYYVEKNIFLDLVAETLPLYDSLLT